ncbi:MAG: PCMD domain-containing protein [Paludibacteraceae bacterium]|nr:PCMD domain-containing protein [Paludibacteraceae bacterium]
MKKTLFLLLAATASLGLNAEKRVEKLPYADFEQWAVRYIKESGILGGNTVTLYAVAPTDTIRENKPFAYGRQGNIWSVSNAYAKVSGIEKGSGTLRPEYRDAANGWCCRMDSKLETVTALGIIDVRVLVSGTLFTGKTIEPIRTQKDPYQNIDFGVPFTKRPAALVFDYKAKVSPDQTILIAKGFGKPKKIAGHAEAQVLMVLQKRWEDAGGNIFAERVGTAFERITKDQDEWVNRHEVPILYGDLTDTQLFRTYEASMGLCLPMRAMNSKGKIVPVKEVGWAAPGTAPTHMIINLASGYHEAFVGYDGNTFWVDNVGLMYE